MSSHKDTKDEDFLTPEETSIITGITVQSLATLRYRKEKFPFYKMGRNIRYKKSEVIAVIESGKVEVSKG